MKTTKPRSSNTSQPVSVNPNLKKKIDNVNTDFIRYISEREERKQTTLMPNKDEEEEEEE